MDARQGRRCRLRLAPVASLWIVAAGFACMACGTSRSGSDVVAVPPPRILLFAGSGTSSNDVAALERILSASGLKYSTVTSRTLDTLAEPELRAYRLLVVPGGNFVQIGTGLSPGGARRIRSAIGSGLNYLGVCAGAFLAGHSPYNGLDLTSGVSFPFYAAEARGIRKAAVAVSTPAGPTLDQYWEDGPQLTGWGEVVAKYPDGTPAVVQGTFGGGWVMLTGIHPEAPETWRRGMTFTTPVAASNAFAATLIDAALNGRRLPHY
jgi:glutamine amidotransferase-like uncharacterized protein